MLLKLLLSVFIGCSSTEAQKIASLEGDSIEGEALYMVHCVGCHGEDGASGTVDEDVIHELHHGDAHVIDVILNGEDEMPAYADILSDQDIANIMAFLHTL